MAYTKTVFTDFQTVITASFLNSLQDQVIANESAIVSNGISDTASGAIASFGDGADNIPIISVVTEFGPVQNLNGYSEPWAGGAGKNKINAPDVVLAEAGTIYSGAISLSAGTYTLSSSNTTVDVTVGETTGPMPLTFTLEEAISSITIEAEDAGTFNDIQIESGSSATSFLPYANECPIIGKTSVSISHSDDDTTNPTVTNISLGSGTVYGASVNTITGSMSVTHGNIASYNGETLPGVWLSSKDAYTSGGTPTSGAQVVYELASPSTVQLTAHPMRTHHGENNIWSSTGNIVVKYWCDIKLYIDKKIEEMVTALQT